MFDSTHPFIWVYYLPKPFQKVFESFWKRIFCSRGMHLYDYIFDGSYSRLSCDVCDKTSYIIESDPEEKLKGKLVGIYPTGMIHDDISLKEIAEKDPKALVLDVNMDNDFSKLLLDSVCLYLNNTGAELEKKELALLLGRQYLNLLNNVKQLNRKINLYNIIQPDFDTFKPSCNFNEDDIRIRTIDELSYNDGWYYGNGEIVIMSYKLKGAWIA